MRKRIAALALIAGIMAVSAASLFAQPRHVVCESKQHDCGHVAKIVSCCCGDPGQPHDSGTPAQQRIQISSIHAIVLLAPMPLNAVAQDVPCGVANTSPPLSHPPDLPTLFACLLI